MHAGQNDDAERRLLEAQEQAGKPLEAVTLIWATKGVLLRQGTIVDATIIHVPASTKNKGGKRDPDMHPTKKGNLYFLA